MQPSEAPSRSRASDAASTAYAASDASAERAVIKSSTGPEPFAGVPVLPPRAPPEPGQVLLRYDVEEGHCWELTATGWCCFWSLACTLPICCCLPCIAPCSMCHPRFQRPVYGYPALLVCDIALAGGGGGCGGAKGEVDAAQEEPSSMAAGVGGSDAAAAAAAAERRSGEQGTGSSDNAGNGSNMCAGRPRPPSLQLAVVQAAGGLPVPLASPPPQSIFVPPSAVPAIGFSVPSPGYPKYRAEPSPAAPPGAAAAGAPSPAAAAAAAARLPSAAAAAAAAAVTSPAAHQPLPLPSSAAAGSSNRRSGIARAGSAQQHATSGTRSGRTARSGPPAAPAPPTRPSNDGELFAGGGFGGALSLATWGSRRNSRDSVGAAAASAPSTAGPHNK